MKSGIWCRRCYNAYRNPDTPDCVHPKGNCPESWLDSKCPCDKGITDFERMSKAMEDQMTNLGYNIKSDSAIGIDSDYDSNIPEPKVFTPKQLVEKLNKEELWPQYGKTYSIKVTQEWRWQTDFVNYQPTPFTLYYDTIAIGTLEQDFDNPFDKSDQPSFENFIPSGDCTVEQVRFIRECTGWKIEI
jgi:hypothetical protein